MTEYIKLSRENKDFGKALRALQKIVSKEKRFPTELLINELALSWGKDEEAIRREYERAILTMRLCSLKGGNMNFVEPQNKKHIIKPKFFNIARRRHMYILVSKKGLEFLLAHSNAPTPHLASESAMRNNQLCGSW